MSNGRNYPPRDTASGDCPICYKYQSRSRIVWRGMAFCCKQHMRKCIHETLLEESIDEYQDMWKELAEK